LAEHSTFEAVYSLGYCPRDPEGEGRGGGVGQAENSGMWLQIRARDDVEVTKHYRQQGVREAVASQSEWGETTALTIEQGKSR